MMTVPDLPVFLVSAALAATFAIVLSLAIMAAGLAGIMVITWLTLTEAESTRSLVV